MDLDEYTQRISAVFKLTTGDLADLLLMQLPGGRP